MYSRAVRSRILCNLHPDAVFRARKIKKDFSHCTENARVREVLLCFDRVQDQTTPNASIESATFRKPAMFAPAT